jgi:LPS export ABC transporter protein LptC
MRSFLKKQWPLLGLGILLAVVCFYLFRSGEEVIQETFIEDIMPGEGLRFNGFHYAQNNPDKGVTWAIDAKEMRSSGDMNSISFNEFRMKVTPKDKPGIELTGEKGDYSRESGEMNLWGDLEGVSENGFKFVSDHLLINEKSRQLSTDKPVKIIGPYFSVHGRGLSVDLENETLKIHTNVIAVLNEDPLT